MRLAPEQNSLRKQATEVVAIPTVMVLSQNLHFSSARVQACVLVEEKRL